MKYWEKSNANNLIYDWGHTRKEQRWDDWESAQSGRAGIDAKTIRRWSVRKYALLHSSGTAPVLEMYK